MSKRMPSICRRILGEAGRPAGAQPNRQSTAKLYGLTLWDIYGTTWVINYNKAIFDNLGLSEPKTYADFKALCQTLLDDGIQPIYEPISDGWHHVLWFPENGPRYEQVTPGLAAELNANKATFAGNETMLTDLAAA